MQSLQNVSPLLEYLVQKKKERIKNQPKNPDKTPSTHPEQSKEEGVCGI